MEKVNLEMPYDVALTTSENDSLFVVLLFTSLERADYFHHLLVWNYDVSLNVLKEEDGKFTFIFESSNSPQLIHIKTKRTLDNNPTLKKLLDESYKNYSYLTCGYTFEQRLYYNQERVYPLTLSHYDGK